MFIKLGVILLVLHSARCETENHDWDLAVVINDQIELLLSNGSLIGSTFEQFSKLKAVTFDNVRHQFVVSDMDQQNDTIFTVQLTKETDVTPIIEDLPDDVQGLAIDPITDILYWTDSVNRTINYVGLNDSTYQSKNFIQFIDENPQDVAIDICRRYIYWTNSNINKPSIERARLDGTEREILIDSGLYRPAGIAIDYNSQRLFWADMKEGIYYSIESSNLDGKEREVVFEGTHSKPFGVAVDASAVYWTDVNNNALWSISKYEKNSAPKRLREFHEKPLGIVAKNVNVTSIPDCENLLEAVKNYNQSIVEVFKQQTDEEIVEDVVACLNGGELTDNSRCVCPRGYVGLSCEISLCHNYCVHGDCYLSSLGYPQCRCHRGFGGNRCERDHCDGFCLNDGLCQRTKTEFPTCDCREGFAGSRCEISADTCKSFCLRRKDDVLYSKEKEVVCRCIDGFSTDIASNYSAAALLSKDTHSQFTEHFQDPIFSAMAGAIVLMIILIIVLSVFIFSLRRRPRIKKRIIVNKNVTPLTYMPQPTTEQCEITIENCCNMNICETPCFEPAQFACKQNKKDDKKKLLPNMESGDDLY